ncbi:MAG: HIT family protein [Patescibacteria group bacterium]
MSDCQFCRIVQKQEPALVVFENSKYLAFLDKYPQAPGQLQLIPKVHYRWVYEIPEMGDFFLTAQKIIRAIIPVLRADHVTLMALGHQVPHAHLWIVPQYQKEIGVVERRGEATRDRDQEIRVIFKNSHLEC